MARFLPAGFYKNNTTFADWNMEYNNNRNGFFGALPTITKNLIIINFICWLADKILSSRLGVEMSGIFGLNYIFSPSFHVWQPFTYMFVHAGFDHIAFNMLSLLFFGIALERQWGSRRFLTYYLVSGVGAGIVQEIVWYCMYGALGVNAVTIGASGAVFGILFAFAWLFPEERIFLLFFPIPIRSRIFVAIYALLELFLGVAHSDNVAHFAHLGGMLFGWLLILWWRHRGVYGFGKTHYQSRLRIWWDKFRTRCQDKFHKRTGNSTKYHYHDPINNKSQNDSQNTDKEKEINRILDKVKASGYGSLTEEERSTLLGRK